MISQVKHKRVQVTTGSRKKQLKAVLQEMSDYFDSMKADGMAGSVEKDTFILVLDELLENARTHGNNEDPLKKIDIIIEFEAEYVTVTVKDEGEGVDPDCLPDPLSPECRLKRGGRGLYIISHMAELMYNGKGGVSAKLKHAE